MAARVGPSVLLIAWVLIDIETEAIRWVAVVLIGALGLSAAWGLRRRRDAEEATDGQSRLISWDCRAGHQESDSQCVDIGYEWITSAIGLSDAIRNGAIDSPSPMTVLSEPPQPPSSPTFDPPSFNPPTIELTPWIGGGLAIGAILIGGGLGGRLLM